MRLPVLATEPLSASPTPSRIDFLPNSITSSGMSSYLALPTKSATYLVKFCALGAGFRLIAFNSAATGKVAIASELVKNFLRSIRVWPPLSRQYRTPKTFELPGLPRRPHALIQHRVTDKHEDRMPNVEPLTCRSIRSERGDQVGFGGCRSVWK